MSFKIPPLDLVEAVDRIYPGIWPAFLNRLVDGVRDGRTWVQISSWYRSPNENQRVGGSRTSQHQLGLAFDLVAGNPIALERALDRQGIVAVVEGDHVHVQAFPAGSAARAIQEIWGIT